MAIAQIYPGFVRTEFGGYPLLDRSFQPNRLLTAVACVRWQRASDAGMELSSRRLFEVLDPKLALTIRALDLPLDLDWIPLGRNETAQVTDAISLISSSVPEWVDLIQLGLEFGEIPQLWGSISASSFAWPQHVWLSERAFATPAGLAEQVLHEISHQWMYFIEEMAPLQLEGTDTRVVLPSGTRDRTVSELLGALHVSLNLRRLWMAMPVNEEVRVRRLAHLDTYIVGCRDTLRSLGHLLTDEGQALAKRMQEGADAR